MNYALHAVVTVALICGSAFAVRAQVESRSERIARLLSSAQPRNAAGPAAQEGERATADLAADGFIRYLGAPPGHRFVPAQGGANEPEAVARRFLNEHAEIFGIGSPRVDFSHLKTKSRNNRNYARFQQTYAGLPVFAAQATVQTDDAGGVEAVLSDLARDTKLLDNNALDLRPTVSSANAAARAKQSMREEFAGAEIEPGQPELMLYAPAVLDLAGDTRLVWHLNVSSANTPEANVRLLLDAHTGEIVQRIPLVHHALNRQVFDANNTTQDPGTLARAEGSPASSVADVNTAYDFLGATYNFYFLHHSRDSIDNQGLTLSATVRYCEPNGTNAPFCPPRGIAFFWQRRMYFGEGTVTDDVTAHELTHGVTDSESGLLYQNASGAINESFSDIWGEFVDWATPTASDGPSDRWLLAEDLSGGAIRNMKNPPEFEHPDRLGSSFFVSATSTPHRTNDYGGVHVNSGVNNKLCYLLTDGDNFNGYTVTGMGVARVADLYYEANVNLLTSAANWTDLYNALMQAAINLGWSMSERCNLYRAGKAVEIGPGGRDHHVDWRNNCAFPNGQFTCSVLGGPYRAIGDGVRAASPGDVLCVGMGSYNERLTINQSLTIRVCDGPVTIGR